MTRDEETHSRRFSLPRLIVLVGLLVVLAAPALKGWRVYRSATSLQGRIETMQEHTADGLKGLDAEFLNTEILGLRADAVALNNELSPLVPFIQRLTWLPRVGELVPVMPELLRLLDNSTAIAADLGISMLPAIPVLQDDATELTEKSPQLLAIIDQADPSLQATAELWPTVHSDLNTILENPAAREALPWQVRQLLPQVEPLLPLVEKGIESIRVLPEIAALGDRRAYLIVGQNSDELRATGGFLSMTMAVGVEDGRLRGNYIADANVVDNYFDKPYGDPPTAMREFIGIDLFLFRDSNYWPDFPTSGRKMMDFYTYGTGVELDGIFAIDIRFISRLIGAIGPIKVPDTDIVLSEDNTLEILEQAWADGLDLGGVSRKDFLGNIAAGLINHVQSDAFEPNIAQLAEIIDESARDKSLQLYINADEEKRSFSQMGIDGRLRYREGDDVLLVTANNVGVNKANRWVESSLTYDIALAADGSAQATATSTWQHTGPTAPSDEICDTSNFSYKPGEQYATMTLACFWNHLRFYTPINSTLIEADSYPIEANQMKSNVAWEGETRTLDDDLKGFTVFENLMLVPMGAERSMTVSYALASVTSTNSLGEQSYRLNLIRQAGVYPYPPVNIEITLPEGSTLVTSSIEPVKVSGESVSFSTVLRENQLIELTFLPAGSTR